MPGSYLGPIIRVRTGQKVRVRFTHELPEPTIVHWHGLHVPAPMDGHPRLMITRGQTYVYEFEVVNRAGTYWYHPHHHNRTGPQVYAGLAGLLIVSDEAETALDLPSGKEEICWVLQDREFDPGNQFVYRAGMPMAMNGFRILSREVEPALATDWESLRGGFSDDGWKDTVLVMPGERVRVLMHFTRYPGLFLYHCHNLEHEDMGMMRNYRVTA